MLLSPYPPSDSPALTSQNNYPISIAEAVAYFSSAGGYGSSLTGEHTFIKLEPNWTAASTGLSLSGKEIISVPLPDSLLRALNQNRVGARLLFSKTSPDSITADLVVHVADSAYYQDNNGVLDFDTYTGAFVFFNIGQHFKYAIYVDSGAVVGGTDTLNLSIDSSALVQDRLESCQLVPITITTTNCIDVAYDCEEIGSS